MTFGTGFGKLGASFGTLGASSGGALPWDVDAGLLAFEDMSQSQLQSGLTALGFTQTRTGTALRTRTGTTPGSWYEVAANVLGMMPGSTSRYGLLVGSAVTNRCLHSNNMTDTAWTKTNVTAALATGGLVRDADWRGDELVTTPGGPFVVVGDWAGSTTFSATLTVVDGALQVTATGGRGKAVLGGVTLSSGQVLLVEAEGRLVSGGTPAAVQISTGSQGEAAQIVIEFTTSNFESKQAIIINPFGTAYISAGQINNNTGVSEFRRISFRPVDAHTVLTATAANGICAQTITDTSNERIAGVWAKRKTGTGRVWLSQGAVTGSELVTNGTFDSGADWTLNAQSSIAAGVLTYSPSGTAVDIDQNNGTVVAGRLYRCSLQITATSITGSVEIRIKSSGGSGDFSGIIAQGSSPTGTYQLYWQPQTSGNMQIRWRPISGGGSMSIDNVSIFEVAETELSLDSTIQLTRLPAATITNPQIAFRFETSGDAIEVYNVNAQRGTILGDPVPTAGAAVTRNAETCSKTLAETPGAYVLTTEAYFPYSTDPGTVPTVHELRIGANDALITYINTSFRVISVVTPSSIETISLSNVVDLEDQDVLVEVEWDNVDKRRARLNGGSWSSSTYAAPPEFTEMRIGCSGFAATRQWNAPIYHITGIPQ